MCRWIWDPNFPRYLPFPFLHTWFAFTKRRGNELADIIYHLFDAFTAYNASVMEQKKADAAPKAVWPCRLKTIACFARGGRTSLPFFVLLAGLGWFPWFDILAIVLGVDIIEGTLRIGTPLCVVKVDSETKKKTIIPIGKVYAFFFIFISLFLMPSWAHIWSMDTWHSTSLEINHKVLQIVKKDQAGGGVAVKIECASYESVKHYGRHCEFIFTADWAPELLSNQKNLLNTVDDTDEIFSLISRNSIDTLVQHFRSEVFVSSLPPSFIPSFNQLNRLTLLGLEYKIERKMIYNYWSNWNQNWTFQINEFSFFFVFPPSTDHSVPLLFPHVYFHIHCRFRFLVISCLQCNFQV